MRVLQDQGGKVVRQSNVSQYGADFEYLEYETASGFAKKAEDAAIRACACADSASTSETNASTSAELASSSEANAKVSEDAARASATDAALSSTNAGLSEQQAYAASERAQHAFVAAGLAAQHAGQSKTAAEASATAASASETNAKTSETNAKASEDKSYELYEAFAKASVYRGVWNPSSGTWPDPKGTNSYWDVVLDEGETTAIFEGITFHNGDRLIYSVPDSKYYHVAFPAGGVISVNGKVGAVSFTATELGAYTTAEVDAKVAAITPEAIGAVGSAGDQTITGNLNTTGNVTIGGNLTISGNEIENANLNVLGELSEKGQRVYSPNNRPPVPYSTSSTVGGFRYSMANGVLNLYSR